MPWRYTKINWFLYGEKGPRKGAHAGFQRAP
jgi:hypothetical protein